MLFMFSFTDYVGVNEGRFFEGISSVDFRTFEKEASVAAWKGFSIVYIHLVST